MGNVKKNISYQTIYQILATGIPLITSPYLSRVLGANGLGIFSFYNSIVNYFMLFAMLGVSNYGTRCIAQTIKSKETISKKFWEIYSVQLTSSILCVITYFFFVIFLFPESIGTTLGFGIYLLGCMADISWLYFGLEDFKVTVSRNILIKILNVALIFAFVNSIEDLNIYILIMSGCTAAGQLVLWGNVFKYIKFYKIHIHNIIPHIKPIFILFIPILAGSIYHIMDKTMLGMFSTATESGYYYNVDKVINIPYSIILGFCTVLMPKVSFMVKNKSIGDVENAIQEYFRWIIVASVAMAFGIAAISDEFCPIFFGEGYDPCVFLLKIFSIIILIKAISHTMRYLLIIPFENDIIYIYSTVVGAVVNLVANGILLVVFDLGALGAVVGTLLAELVVCIVQICMFTNRHPQIKVHKSIIRSIPIIVIGLLMYTGVRILRNYIPHNVIGLCEEIIFGGILYVFILGILIFLKVKIFKKISGGNIK